MAPALWRMREPIASANRPSTVRYRPAPTTALVTPGWLSETSTTGWTTALPRKNDTKDTTSAITKTSAANTTHFAASTGSLLGTASREARITPVEYSVVIVSAPSTQIA